MPKKIHHTGGAGCPKKKKAPTPKVKAPKTPRKTVKRPTGSELTRLGRGQTLSMPVGNEEDVVKKTRKKRK